jgi:hypothetical protein
MTNQEFSDTFTTLLNSYATQSQFGEQASKGEIVLDEYEKSVLLTQAQDIIVKSYFDRTLNQQGQGFDDSARRQVDFSSLITVAELPEFLSDTATPFDYRGILFEVPSEMLYMLNEQLLVYTVTEIPSGGKAVESKRIFVIVPISFKEYDREMSKPYAQPLKKQAWRLFQDEGSNDYDMVTELIPNENIQRIGDGSHVGDVRFAYKIRFIRRPQPIILENLPNGLEIDGESNASECELNPILHMDILTKAVELALTTRGRIAPQQEQTRRQ